MNYQLHPEYLFERHSMDSMRDQPMPRWLIPGLLFERQIGVLYAPPGSFKSFVALDLCSRLAHGLDWQGKPLTPCRVLYIAGEGFTMFYNRRLAWFQRNQLPPENDGLEVIKGAVDLTRLSEVMKFIAAMRRDCEGMGLVVFDTLSTCTAGEDECDGAVITRVLEHAKLIGQCLDSAVLFVHHPGKDLARGSRGHSSLLGNIDTEWCLQRVGKDRASLHVTKQKDALDGQIFEYVSTQVMLGRPDGNGGEMSSLALTPGSKLAAGRELSRSDADRTSIISMMQPGQLLSLRELARKLRYLGHETQVKPRIKAAIPLEWMRCKRGEGFVLVRRTEHPTRNLQQVEMRDAP